MAKYIEMVGKKFGKLTVIRRSEDRIWGGKPAIFYECLCDCGNRTEVYGGSLRSGRIKTCGCSVIKHHGKRDFHRLYVIWTGMNQRCSDPNKDNWKYYGGKGVRVCDEWAHDFKAFKDWALFHGYQDTLTIDRIDFNGDYSPENCRWISMDEQRNNTSKNVWVTIRGERMTLASAARKLGLTYATVQQRHKRGQEIDAPPKRKRVKNESASVSDGCITSD